MSTAGDWVDGGTWGCGSCAVVGHEPTTDEATAALDFHRKTDHPAMHSLRCGWPQKRSHSGQQITPPEADQNGRSGDPR